MAGENTAPIRIETRFRCARIAAQIVWLSLPLMACGVLKILYDVALLAAFRHLKPPEEQ